MARFHTWQRVIAAIQEAVAQRGSAKPWLATRLRRPANVSVPHEIDKQFIAPLKRLHYTVFQSFTDWDGISRPA